MFKTLLKFFNRIFDTDEYPDTAPEAAPATDSQPADEPQDDGAEVTQDDGAGGLQLAGAPTPSDTTARVLEALKQLGFQPEQMGEVGYAFMYEGTRLLYLPKDDDYMLKLAIPCIYEADENNFSRVLVALTVINKTIRFAKICLIDDMAWIFYEYPLFDQPTDLKGILTHMIPTLDAARLFAKRTFRHYVDEIDQSGDDTDSDSGDTDADDDGETDTTNDNGEE